MYLVKLVCYLMWLHHRLSALLYFTCVPVSVNYSLMKASIGCRNIWITVSVFWLVQRLYSWGVVVAWKSKQRLQSKGNVMARDHLQGSGKKNNTPLPTTLPDWMQTHSWLCNDTVCVFECVYIITGWAPGRVAFRLKAAPVKIWTHYPFILYPLQCHRNLYVHFIVSDWNRIHWGITRNE